MPGTFEPGQIFDNSIREKKSRDISYPLDFSAPVAAVETVNMKAGFVMTLDDNCEFVAGLGDGVANEYNADGKTPIAIFKIQNSDAFDVRSDIGNISGGVHSGLVATGGYELETTAFDTDAAALPLYVPNRALTFGVGSARGVVTPAIDAYNQQHLVGVVTSKAVSANEWGKNVVSFWTVFCPANTVTP